MDDTWKIQALMVYYEHWGKKELQSRKTAHGVNKTISLLAEQFQTHGRTLKVGLEQRLECMRSFQEIYLFWVDLVDIFIAYSAFDLLLDHEYYTTEDGRMDAWKNRLCKSLRLEEDEIIRFLYNELSPHEILSVDAVVALL